MWWLALVLWGGALDGGATLSAEDQEVVENLDLLENLDGAGDFDLLEAL